MSIRTHYMPKMLKNGKSGNPVVEIWQPCWSDNILSASIRFLDLRNIGLGRKIMFLGHLELKLCEKFRNIVQNIL